jgi:hypothetical protein
MRRLDEGASARPATAKEEEAKRSLASIPTSIVADRTAAFGATTAGRWKIKGECS